MAENAGMYLWIFLLVAPLVGAIIDLAMTPKPPANRYDRTTPYGSTPGGAMHRSVP